MLYRPKGLLWELQSVLRSGGKTKINSSTSSSICGVHCRFIHFLSFASLHHLFSPFILVVVFNIVAERKGLYFSVTESKSG